MSTVRQYRGRYVADFRDQNGRRRIEAPRGRFETRAEEKRAAKELLDRRLTEVRAGSFLSASERPSFGRLCELFLASKVAARKTTLDGYRELIDCYLLPYFGENRALESITRLTVEQFRAEMATGAPPSVAAARGIQIAQAKAAATPRRLKPLKPGARTTNKALIVMHGVLAYATKHGMVTRNAAADIDSSGRTARAVV